jgi:hypothetical protein
MRGRTSIRSWKVLPALPEPVMPRPLLTKFSHQIRSKVQLRIVETRPPE